MVHAILSDIHANYEAFNSVMRFLLSYKQNNNNGKNSVSKIIILGDIVGYGPKPNETIDRIRRLFQYNPKNDLVICCGNHDVYSQMNPKHLVSEQLSKIAAFSTLWTMNTLTPINKKFMHDVVNMSRGLKYIDDTCIAAHANIIMPGDFKYVFNRIGEKYFSPDEEVHFSRPYDNIKELEKKGKHIGFIGHTHIPMMWKDNSVLDAKLDEVIELKEDSKYLVNVGSVGQPRDGNNTACFVLYDPNPEKPTVTFKSVNYNIEKAMQDTEDSKMTEDIISKYPGFKDNIGSFHLRIPGGEKEFSRLEECIKYRIEKGL